MSTYVAAPLKTINQTQQTVAKYEQEVIYPNAAINQARNSVTQFESQFSQVGTAAGHAGLIRSSIKSATGKDEPASAGEDTAGAQESPGPVRGSGAGSGSGSKSASSAPTFASVNRGNPWAWSSYAPHPRRDGIATWGAYHAARVATKAAVTGRNAIDNAGKASD